MKVVRTRWLFLLCILNLVIVLACLPAEPAQSVPTPPNPDMIVLPTPTPLPTPIPPTPTPTPAPGRVIVEMTRKHELLDKAEVGRQMATFLPAGNCLPAQYDVDTYRIWFRTLDANGATISIQADLRFPHVSEPQNFPILVYGAGTTGIASQCAALNEHFVGRQWGNYRIHMLSYASQGYISILPNGQGYDSPEGIHHYFVSELEARVMLDAARAVYDFFAAPPDPDIQARPDQAVFFAGYSQGGHAAFSAGRLGTTYAPELQIKGLIGHAMSPDVEGLMVDSPRYSPYIVYAYRNLYGPEVIDPADVFQPYWLPTFESDVTSKCIEEALFYYSNDPGRMYTPAFRQALYSGQLGTQFPAFKALLDANDCNGRPYPPIPALLLHGAEDPIVRLRTIESFVAELCSQGTNVTYRVYPGVTHFDTRQCSFRDTLIWMRTILNGDAPVSTCPRPAG